MLDFICAVEVSLEEDVLFVNLSTIVDIIHNLKLCHVITSCFPEYSGTSTVNSENCLKQNNCDVHTNSLLSRGSRCLSRLVACFSARRTGLIPRPVFEVDKVAL